MNDYQPLSENHKLIIAIVLVLCLAFGVSETFGTWPLY